MIFLHEFLQMIFLHEFYEWVLWMSFYKWFVIWVFLIKLLWMSFMNDFLNYFELYDKKNQLDWMIWYEMIWNPVKSCEILRNPANWCELMRNALFYIMERYLNCVFTVTSNYSDMRHFYELFFYDDFFIYFMSYWKTLIFFPIHFYLSFFYFLSFFRLFICLLFVFF